MYLLDKVRECFYGLMRWFGFDKALGAVTVRWQRRRPQPVLTRPPINTSKIIDYMINDETTPQLVKKAMSIPDAPQSPKFSVKNYKGGGFSWGTNEWQAACVYTHMVNAMQWVNHHSVACGCKPFVRWAGSSNLVVLPQAGVDANAFYNRASLQFFFFTDKSIRKTIYAANSADVVTHELGHAIFDSYRPATWSSASLEVGAFHEAFGDIVAMLSLMQHDEVLLCAIGQTNGDLTKNNVISNLAEEFGRSIYNMSPNGRNPECLRSAINNFKYANPSDLKKEAVDSELSSEVHSFSRVFLGAVYDMIVMIYNESIKEGMNQLDALRTARNVMCQYILKAIQNAPLTTNFYQSMATTMLWADFSTTKKYHDKMVEVFAKRNIATGSVRAMSAEEIPVCSNENLVVKAQSVKSVKLSDHFVRAQSQEENGLYDVEIDIPMERAFLYDSDKSLYEVVDCDEEESLVAAQDFIIHLHEKKLVVSDENPNAPFLVQNGKLRRSHFTCGCC